MGRYILAILMYVLPCAFIVADEGWSPVKDPSDIIARFHQANSRVRSIECRFRQEKVVDVLADTAESYGIYRYFAPDSMVVEYVSPERYAIIISGDRLKIVSPDRTTERALSSDRRLASLSELMRSGGIPSGGTAGYEVEGYENPDCYRLVIHPRAGAGNTVEVIIDRKDLSLDSFRIREGGSDYTEFVFTDKKILASPPVDE